VAPKLTFTIQDVTAFQAQQLNTGEIDVLITLEEFVNPNQPSRLFLSDEVVVLAWSGNPLKKGELDEDTFFSLGHVVVQFNTIQQPAYESWLSSASSRARRKEIFVPSFSDVPFFLIGTERLGVIQGALGKGFSETLPVTAHALPFDLPPLKLALQWNGLNSGDAGLNWLLERLTEPEFGEA
jgi:LysR family nod box-dependent transcriptional activator